MGDLLGNVTGYQMGVAKRHGDGFVAHELHKLMNGDLSGLGEPRPEGVPPSMEGDAIGASHSLLHPKVGNDAAKGGHCAATAISVFVSKEQVASLRLDTGEHSKDVLRGVDFFSPTALADKVDAPSLKIYVLGAEAENFGGAKAGVKAEKRHLIKLGASLMKGGQQPVSLSRAEKTKTLVLDFGHGKRPTLFY